MIIRSVLKRAFATSFVDSLKARGLIERATGNIPDSGVTAAYVGFDPTASSLHIGNLQALVIMGHMWSRNIKPVIVIGGATGGIGDPSGRDHERPVLPEVQLQANIKSIMQQTKDILGHIRDAMIDRRGNKESMRFPEIEYVNNMSIYESFNVIRFMREVGRHMRMGMMLNREIIKSRLASPEGISYQEFSYQMFQAYDFFWLSQHRDCRMQIGGSDQWGNICSGCELIRKITGKEAFGVTYPLLTNSKGEKYSKSLVLHVCVYERDRETRSRSTPRWSLRTSSTSSSTTFRMRTANGCLRDSQCSISSISNPYQLTHTHICRSWGSTRSAKRSAWPKWPSPAS